MLVVWFVSSEELRIRLPVGRGMGLGLAVGAKVGVGVREGIWVGVGVVTAKGNKEKSSVVKLPTLLMR